DHVKLGDFGLVQSRADLAAERATACAPGAITPRYAAPELFRGALSPTSDQYSLAVVYQELLTGVMPFRCKNSRQLAVQHTRGAPDGPRLSAADGEGSGGARGKKPSERSPPCRAMVEAREAAGRPAVPVGGEPLPARGAAPPGGGAPRPPGV